jgi:hypothetical protein
MTDIDPIQYSLKRHRHLLDDPHHGEFMKVVQAGYETVEELLDALLLVADDHDWKTERLIDHCFVAQVLWTNQLILKGYPGDIPVPPGLDRLIRVMAILDRSFAPPLPFTPQGPFQQQGPSAKT